MPWPDTHGADVYSWVGAKSSGLAHLIRQSYNGPSWRAMCESVFDMPPSAEAGKHMQRCGICREWLAEHPDAEVKGAE